LVVGLGHIFLVTIGMAGAYQGMKTGKVDEEWAREHHELWYNDIKSGKPSADPEGDKARGVAQPASGPAD
jgi:formate dehydrogenase subunit gamma